MMALDLVDVPASVVDTDPPHDACAGGSNTRGAKRRHGFQEGTHRALVAPFDASRPPPPPPVAMFRDVVNSVLMRSFALIAEGWRAATPLRESLDPPKGHLLELTRQKDIYLRTNVFTCVGTYYMIYESKYSSGVW